MNARVASALIAAAMILSVGIILMTDRTPATPSWDDAVQEARRGGYSLLTTEELRHLYESGTPGLLLVDTRQDWEHRTGHIPGSVLFPMEPTAWARWTKRGDLEKLLGPDKDRPTVFYWAGLTWVRSDSAARVAVSLGYKNVYRDPKGFPDWQAAGLPVETGPVQPPSTQVADDPGPLTGWAMVWTLLGIFLGGMALNLTPCVYPLIPITVSYFGGRSDHSGSLVGHGILYMVGLALTNSALGVVAALTGGMMGAMLQSPAVLIGISALLAIFATSLFGFWELRLPMALTRVASKSHAGYFGTFFMGLTLGVVAAPCLGPFVLGLLTWVAGMGSAWIGFAVFFTLSLGLGLPLFVLAIFSGRIEKLPRSGEWMIWVRKLMGWVLLGMAAYFIRPLLSESAAILTLSVVAFAAGIHLGWIDKATAGFATFKYIKPAIGVLAITVAIVLSGSWLLRGPGVTWEQYSQTLLDEAKAAGKPVIIDFSASWCAPCRELDEITFHDPAVVRISQDNFIMIKVDLTRGGNAEHERLVSAYEVKGVPTVIFIDAQGRERKDLRLVDYLPPDVFVQRMENLKTTNEEWRMLKVHLFLNEPNGKPWKHFLEMLPRLGAKYDIEVEITSQPKDQYQTDEYFDLELPVAPAVMVGAEVVTEGSDIAEDKLEAAMRRHLDLPDLPRKGFVSRLLGAWGPDRQEKQA